MILSSKSKRPPLKIAGKPSNLSELPQVEMTSAVFWPFT